MIAGAIAGPFLFHVDAGNHGHFVTAWGEYHAQALVIAGSTFHCIFVAAGLAFQFTFPVIDGSVFKYLHNLRFIYMPATHTAPGMPGIVHANRVAVQPFAGAGGIGLLSSGGVIDRYKRSSVSVAVAVCEQEPKQ